jgi:glycerol-3-phosphate dehydrogenase
MWSKGWRDRLWSDLDQRWDLIVIGGGITGAGILREASRAGESVARRRSRFCLGTQPIEQRSTAGCVTWQCQTNLIDSVTNAIGCCARRGHRAAGHHRQLSRRPAGGVGIWRGPDGLRSAGVTLAHALHGGARAELCPPHNRSTGGWLSLLAQTDDARLVLALFSKRCGRARTTAARP